MPRDSTRTDATEESTELTAAELSTVGGFPRRSFLKVAGLGALAGSFSASGATAGSPDGEGKTRPTLFPPAERATARKNVDTYDWAADIRDRVVSSADAYLANYEDLDGLWNLVTSQELPRSSGVGPGSPVTGDELPQEYGPYGWAAVPKDSVSDPREPGVNQTLTDVVTPTINISGSEDFPWKPWKLVDPTSGYVFPTNDFAAYRESGRDEAGKFDPDLADDSLLVNELYPDKPDDWGVDDGTGWTDADGNTYTFAAYYNHFYVWYSLRFMCRVFRDAYLLSGERKYARAATVILDRIADVYPELDVSVWPPSAPYSNSTGGSGQGKAVGCIWETDQIKAFTSCYDAAFPGQAEDARLVDFLSSKAATYDVGPKSNLGDVRENIEDGLVKQVLPAVKDAQIRGNFGSHQSALAMSAVVQDDPTGYTKRTVDFLFEAGEYVQNDDGSGWPEDQITGGNVLPRIVNAVDRDGHHNESPSYNQGHTQTMQSLAEILNGYDAYEGADLFDNVKVEKMHSSLIHLVMLNRDLPNVGDSWKTGNQAFEFRQAEVVKAFEEYGDPIFAQAAYLLGDNSFDNVDPGVFTPNAGELDDRFSAVIEAEGPLDLPSEMLAGYGFTGLRDGTIDLENPANDTSRALWTYYGRNSGPHHHYDTLNLGLFAHRMTLAPDLGYPENTGDWPKRENWTSNTVSHNTVVVDGERQRDQWVSTPRHFDATDRVKLTDVEADVYPQTETYRRTTAMIAVDEERSYAVDFFRVTGGDDHRFSFHGAEADVGTTGLELTAQDGGTYAGEDVPKPGYGEDTAYNQEVGNGFNYLHDVERDADPDGSFSVDWDVVDTWDVREDDAEAVALRLTMLTDCDEVALADGNPPDKPGNPDSLKYLLARRSGSDLESTFTSVVEPYEGSSAIESITAVDATADGGTDDVEAVKVELSNGRTDYVVRSTDADRMHTIDETFKFKGFFAVYSEVDGEPEHAYVQDGKLLNVETDAGPPVIQRPQGRVTGTVDGFTRDLSAQNRIDVKLRGRHTDPAELVGNWIYVETDGERNGAYRIEDVTEGRGNRVTLDVGDTTTVKGLVDSENPDEGYVYTIAEGAQFSIPLSATWTDGSAT